MTKSSVSKEAYDELKKKYDDLKKDNKRLKHENSNQEEELSKQVNDKGYYKTVGSNQVLCIQKMLDIMMNMPEARKCMADCDNGKKNNPNDCK